MKCSNPRASGWGVLFPSGLLRLGARQRPQVAVHAVSTDTVVSTSQQTVEVVTEEKLAAFRSLYCSMKEEKEYAVQPDMIEGTIPSDLQGTLLRNGPAMLDINGVKINQPFDGDGMVWTFGFRDGRVFVRGKYVKTEGFVAEQKAGKPLYQGVFATGVNSPSWFNNPLTLEIKNVANTGVIYWGGKILALHESGLPHELTDRLDTVGPTNLDNTVEGKGPLSAHYRVVQMHDGSKRLCIFSAKQSGLDADVTLFEYDESGKCLHKTKAFFKSGGLGFYHDLAVTENYYILVENPVRLSYTKLASQYILKKCSFAECLTFRKDIPTKIHLVPRPGATAKAAAAGTLTFTTSSWFTFHHGNAFETLADDGSLVVAVDLVLLPEGVDFSINTDTLDTGFYKSSKMRSELHRMTINLSTGDVQTKRVVARTCEFPIVHPAVVGKRHSHIYAAASAIDHPVMWGPNQAIMKLTLDAKLDGELAVQQDIWQAADSGFTGEPIFVPRAGSGKEDDGWLLALVHNAESLTADLVVLDAADVSAGPVATIHLPHHIPPQLHGSWSDSYIGADGTEH